MPMFWCDPMVNLAVQMGMPKGGIVEFEHITYDEKTGKNSKPIETYNFHKAAAVLAEYGFDCIRLSDDWGERTSLLTIRSLAGRSESNSRPVPS